MLNKFVAAAVLTVAVSPFSGAAARAANNVPAPVSVNGAMSVTVAPATGSEAITVSGTAPAMAPVVVLLHATISRDLPNVFVNRRDVFADADGHFSTVVPIGPDFWRGSILTVSVSSSSATASANAQTIVTLPNPGVVLPADDVPSH
ncbi:MAG: hypothetical protein JO241_08500 [Candidatus Eremiobacteraeota bacterium]|nr:hypothetical protein [Candidatus Eremiobacteraeota bacterium]MBV8584020.1 hypothetical protein [Candidatus Eremiobacteraeota bacterium]